ncbi:MAG TPA: APC family permease [Terriglobales bacterium]|jgi:APA family basic amino acid/polyamine antiporter|nr:APC family permease [Terriglobales bacterium]
MTENSSPPHPQLTRGFGLLQATALNISNVVGVGPFITIPLMLATMGGPQAMLGWIAGALLAICDGQVWSELGSVWPGSGGSYRYLKEAYGPQGLGSLLAFLFIWQFILSGPLEISSGMIGFSQYTSFLWPAIKPMARKLIAAGVGIAAIALLYRRTNLVGKLALVLGAGTLLTMIVVVVAGALHFDAKLAFSFPPGAFSFKTGFFLGLGSSMLIAMYDYLGYYDVCYIGDEVRDPGRTIPRSILYCILITAVCYLAIEIVIIGVVPWRDAMQSNFIVSEFMQRLYGHTAALMITVMILWTAFGSVFALLLGYSRIPYAAAQDGNFFAVFARIHPSKNFPHVSLLVIGAVSVAGAFFSLDAVISALITTRVLVQFIAQILALPRMRRLVPEEKRPYKMWLYPVPAVIAAAGWIYIFATSGWKFIVVGLVTLVVGIAVFLIRAAYGRTWPYAEVAAQGSAGSGRG